MKKYLLIVITVVILMVMPVNAWARAGGASGGGGGTSTGGTGTTSSNTGTDTDYHASGFHRNRLGGYSRGNDFLGAGFMALLVTAKIRDYRQKHGRTRVKATSELSAAGAADFTELFMQVEAAWETNNQLVLADLMTKKYFKKQQKILNGYQRKHQINRLEGMTIINLEQEHPQPKRLRIVVTAQARDYFVRTDLSVEANEAIRDQTYIERFTEIWELQLIDGHWLVNKILPVT